MGTRKMETRELPCTLTASELTERSDRLAALTRECVDVERHKKHVAADLKEKLDALTEERVKLADIVTTRREFRKVEVIESRNPSRKTMDTYRVDTGEVVDSRALSPAELQDELFPFAARDPRLPNDDDHDEARN